MSFDIEKALIEIAQTNQVTVNVGNHIFQAVTLCEYHKELLDACETEQEFLDEVSNLCLGIKGGRALDFEGISEQKLDMFWSRSEFSTESDLSIRHQFAEDALKESGFLSWLDRFAPDEEEAIEVDAAALIQDTAAYQQQA